MRKLKFCVVALMVMLITSSNVLAEESKNFSILDSIESDSTPLNCDGSKPESETENAPLLGSIYVELGGASKPNTRELNDPDLSGANDLDVVGGSIGITYKASKFFTWNGGLTFLTSEHYSDLFTGLSMGIRTNSTAYPVMPFVGLGVFAGNSKETVVADDDGRDNDDNGDIDESGEEDEIIDDVICSFYPEIGVNFMLSENKGMMFIAKRHYTSKGKDFRFWMYSMAFSIYF